METGGGGLAGRQAVLQGQCILRRSVRGGDRVRPRAERAGHQQERMALLCARILYTAEAGHLLETEIML